MRPAEVLEQIRRQPKGRASFKYLVRLLHLKGDERRELQGSLDELVRQGRLFEWRKGSYRLPERNDDQFTGRISLHPRGFGFVTPDRPLPGFDGGDIYIGPRSIGDAMHGDRVLAKLVRIRHDGRAAGRVERVLDRAQSLVVGRFRYSPHGSHVVPEDERVQTLIEIERGSELPPAERRSERLGNVTPPEVASAAELDGMVVTVAVSEYPTRNRAARGRVVEVLGRADDFGVDVEIIIRKFHLPYRFPPEALAEAEAAAEKIDEAEIAGRRDFRDRAVVTIDGETARDFDDAVRVDRLEGGGFRLEVHIADVSHYVKPDSALDREARLRGTSAYFPDRAVPMLPARLSTGVCSLKEGVDRLVVSALLTIDPRGEIVAAEFRRGVIRGAERMTYTAVFAVLQGDAEALVRYRPLVEQFRLMRDLAEVLRAKRERRGAIDIDLPEAEIEFDERGRMTGVKAAERTVAHRIIEEFMLAANEAVARRLEEAAVPFLHRVHDKPNLQSVAEFEEIARSFGHSLGRSLSAATGRRKPGRGSGRRAGARSRDRTALHEPESPVRPRDYQLLAKRIAGRPEERVLSYRMLRSLQRARYSEEKRGHFALAADRYLHFTSPIRRYPDLVVHRILTSVLAGGPKSPYGAAASGPYSLDEAAAIAAESSQAERRAADAERALIDWKKARFIEERLGEEFEAVVTAAGEVGLFIELIDLYIDGLVPIDSFPGRGLEYRENLRALVGARGGARYGLGDRIRVRADRVGFDRMRAEFTCLGLARISHHVARPSA